MYRFLFLVFGLTLIHSQIVSQNHWEIYTGLNHSNIIHNYGEQQLYNHTLNSPLWNYGFQLGVNKAWSFNDNYLTAGLRLQMKGDKKSLNEISPNLDYYGLRFVDLMVPVNLNYRILNSKDIFLKAGISGNYLVLQSKVRGIAFFPIHGFTDKLGISGQIGFNFMVKGRISAEFMYSQAFTNIYAITEVPIGVNDPDKTTYKHQAFEFSILYKL